MPKLLVVQAGAGGVRVEDEFGEVVFSSTVEGEITLDMRHASALVAVFLAELLRRMA